MFQRYDRTVTIYDTWITWILGLEKSRLVE